MQPNCPFNQICQGQPKVIFSMNYDGPRDPDATYQVLLKLVEDFSVYVLRFNVPVNNFLVMFRVSH